VLYGHVLVPIALLLAGFAIPALRRRPAWMIAAVMGATAVVLIALPEIAFVRDIYGEDHRRANTMFKFTFQAQPLAVMASCIAVGVLISSRRAAIGLTGFVLAVPLLLTLSYAENIYSGLVRDLPGKRFTLDGLGFINRDQPEDRDILDWLRTSPHDEANLLVEAPGESFTSLSRFSAMSGVATLVGWRGHEWLWRGMSAPVYARADEVSRFYRAPDTASACILLQDYPVTHVAIGVLERQAFPEMQVEVLLGLGEVVVRSGASLLLQVDRERCSAQNDAMDGE
jgi:uncharacterized membrane protein